MCVIRYTLIFAIGIVIIPEIATPGFEGIVYGASTPARFPQLPPQSHTRASNASHSLVTSSLVISSPRLFESRPSAVTTYQNCSQNITAVLNNLLLAIWQSNTSQEQLESDTPEVKRNMAFLTVLTVLVALSSLFVLPLLPSQKPEIARLKTQPGSIVMGNLMMLLLVFMMVVGTVFSCLPIFPSTACLIIAGGSGC